MTRKDYAAFANEIKWIEDPKERERTAKLIADVCKSDNGRFDRDKFYAACNVELN